MSRIFIKNAIGIVAISAGLLSLPQDASASPIMYTVNQVIGPGSVTGTITTDGTLGTLADADIISWNLLLNNGPNTVVVQEGVNGSNAILTGTALTASLTTLTFNYSSGIPSDLNIFNTTPTPSLQGQLCYTNFSNCWGPDGVGVYNVGGDGSSVYIGQIGSQIIATGGVPVLESVPEPVSLALLALGLFGLGLSMRKKA